MGLPETISLKGLPRVQEIFEARNPKGQAVITEVTGDVIDISEDPATRTKEVTIKGKQIHVRILFLIQHV